MTIAYDNDFDFYEVNSIEEILTEKKVKSVALLNSFLDKKIISVPEYFIIFVRTEFDAYICSTATDEKYKSFMVNTKDEEDDFYICCDLKHVIDGIIDSDPSILHILKGNTTDTKIINELLALVPSYFNSGRYCQCLIDMIDNAIKELGQTFECAQMVFYYQLCIQQIIEHNAIVHVGMETIANSLNDISPELKEIANNFDIELLRNETLANHYSEKISDFGYDLQRNPTLTSILKTQEECFNTPQEADKLLRVLIDRYNKSIRDSY